MYRLVLGNVKELRERFNIPLHIPDTHIVVKIGASERIQERLEEHRRTFKHFNIDRIFPVDKEKQFKAEKPLLQFHERNSPFSINTDTEQNQNRRELFIWNPVSPILDMDLQNVYDHIQLNYCNVEISTFERQITELQNQLIIETLKRENVEKLLKQQQEHNDVLMKLIHTKII